MHAALLTSLLYISRARLGPADADREVEAIVRIALERNARLGVTGALLFTGTRFAQWLEGPAAAIDELMASIERDPRHERVDIVERAPTIELRFPDWSMAYWGSATFVDGLIAALEEPDLATPQREHHVARLSRAIRQMALLSGGTPIGRG